MLRIAFIASLLAATPAVAQDPANPNTPDGTRAAPIEIVMGLDSGNPTCAPDAFRLPVGNPVILVLRNGASRTLDFTAPELFAASEIADREGGQAWVTEDGAVLARVPAAGDVELAFTATEAGDFTFGCLVSGEPDGMMTGTIAVIPTPGDG